MDCPHCSHQARVLESRRAEDGAAMRRRRHCPACGYRFTTYERAEREPLFVRKRGGERQRFDRPKLRAALLRAAHKRPVTAEDVDAIVWNVEQAIVAAGGELPAERVSALCLEGLRRLDEGAFMQFAGTLPTPSLAPIRPDVPSGSAGSMRRSPYSPVGSE